MDCAHSYTYPCQAAGHSRYASTHGTSSAFSASANPNEDWTKISDLAERRRIQNRIAQRNYRKKLKRRLEDLERRAASSSASPEQSHEESVQPSVEKAEDNVGSSKRRSVDVVPQVDRRRSPDLFFNHSNVMHDDRGAMFSQQCTRQLSASPPPAFSYSTYSSAESPYHNTYPRNTAYQSMPMTYVDFSYQSQYNASVSPTLPTILPSDDGMKREPFFAEDDLMNPFGMAYASIAGYDHADSQAYSDTSAQVNTTNLF